MNRQVVALVAAATLLAGCAQNPVGIPTWGPWQVPLVSLEALSAAPDTVTVDAQSYRLEAHAWRNFQPIVPDSGPPMYAVAKLIEADSLAIAQDVELAYLWMVRGEDSAGVPFLDPAQPGWPPWMQVKRAAHLPQWGPHIFVDIVVAVRDPSGGLTLVAARDVWIERAD